MNDPVGDIGTDDSTQAVPRSVADDDPRLVEALAAYVSAAEAGRRPNRQEFLARYPDVARELASSLAALAFVHSAAGQVNGTGARDTRGADDRFEAEIIEGRALGDFRLVREIGRGGMGVVYEAVQLSLGRRVALKVLSFAAAMDHRHLQRFHNEAQAAAQLHHSNIVPVYAVGCERSVHFYAMQLIDGQSLAGVIEELRAARGITGRAGDLANDPPAARN
ncbi:MAG TPA: protein kinase, partial [Tepidisphaeraceae bacterium]|nr:protein kinase [Tepidisphaeraceae bacterium]